MEVRKLRSVFGGSYFNKPVLAWSKYVRNIQVNPLSGYHLTLKSNISLLWPAINGSPQNIYKSICLKSFILSSITNVLPFRIEHFNLIAKPNYGIHIVTFYHTVGIYYNAVVNRLVPIILEPIYFFHSLANYKFFNRMEKWRNRKKHFCDKYFNDDWKIRQNLLCDSCL